MNGWQVTPIDGTEIRYTWTTWELVATWPQPGREIQSIVTILHTATDTLAVGPTRINWLSNSQKTNLGQAMRRLETGNMETDTFIQHVSQDQYRRHRQAGTPTMPIPAPQDGSRWLAYPIWPSVGGTIVGAATNSFKSMIAVALALQIQLGTEILHGNTRATTEAPILYCDWETNQATFAERMHAILKGADLDITPSIAYLKPRGPLSVVYDQLTDMIRREGYGGVILDSLSAGVGGSLIEDKLANEFWDAVEYLDTPALITAHKSEEAIRRGHKKVFGSVMHHNRPRMIWDAQRDSHNPMVRWEVVNDNNSGLLGKKLAWHVAVATVGEDENERLDSVTFAAKNPQDIRLAANEGDTIADRVAYWLTENGPHTSAEIADGLEMKPNNVRAQLSRHDSLFEKLPDGQRWTIK